MHAKQAKLGRFCVFVLATAIVAVSLSAQQSTHTRISLVTDWSSRHLIFSQPSTAAKLAEVSQDPRFQQQWLRRNLQPAPPRDGDADAAEIELRNASEANDAALRGGNGVWGGGPGGLGVGGSKANLKRDWSASLGPRREHRRGHLSCEILLRYEHRELRQRFRRFRHGHGGSTRQERPLRPPARLLGRPTNGQTVTLTYGSGAVDTVTATAAAKASTTGTFSGAPTSRPATIVVHGASNATLTAEDNTAATGTSPCPEPSASPGQGVTINGTL